MYRRVPHSLWAFPFPQLLPDADNFKLTIREAPTSSLPLGKSCGGEAAVTLACRAFVVTLKNIGQHTVRLSRIACMEPVVWFEMKEPNSSSGWAPISSQPSRSRCSPWVYKNIRLRPGKSVVYKTGLISPSRPAEFWAPVKPGSYTVRAHWMLWGCTENSEGSDCLASLQIMKANSWGGPPTGDVELQDPVDVVSKPIEVQSPPLPDLGPLKLGFEISLTPEAKAIEVRKRLPASCSADQITSLQCTVFHYAIRNLSNRPVRNGRYTCSDFSIIPEYRTNSGEWKRLQSRLRFCTANIYFETPILPGAAAEGGFTLTSLAPMFDTSPLYPAGKYQIRFSFQSSACWASPNGSFCIQRPKEQVVESSNVLTINATAYAANGSPARPD